MIRARTIMAVLCLGLTALLMTTPPNATAHSSVGGTTLTTCNGLNMHEPYDSSIDYYFSGVSSDFQDAVHWIMRNDVNPTDLQGFETFNSTASYMDVRIYDGAYSDWCGANWYPYSNPGTVGMAKCSAVSQIDATACRWHTVAISSTWVAQASAVHHKRLACHEIGHVLGIPHNEHSISEYNNSCMRDGVSSPGTDAFYSNHEVNNMINSVW